MTDTIRKNKYTYYKSHCSSCGCDRGFQRKQLVDGFCRSCSSKIKIAKIGNPMKGKKHLNKSKFRKLDHPNVDYNTLKIILLPCGHNKKVYRQTCPKCHADVGYRRTADATRTCRRCQDENLRKYSPEQKRIRIAIKSNVSIRLRSRRLNKPAGTTEILPFNINELFTHLESKFKPGMSWENYGEWELDHIVPDSWFEYSSVYDPSFKESWALSNLQPMWKVENASKSNKYSGSYDPEYKNKK